MLRVRNAAILCDVSRSTIDRWSAAGLIRTYKVRPPGGKNPLVLIDRESLLQFIRGGGAVQPGGVS